jgi:2-polyprenyl-3-methyl-5-hydroxy-6-metoxy-1,4-benzoquinol methylase
VSSIDASDYENATYVHDLNVPIPDHLKGQFDLVDDGGTLEHVFNFPVALRNCMEMVKVGGHLLLNVPTNNFVGHGF